MYNSKTNFLTNGFSNTWNISKYSSTLNFDLTRRKNKKIASMFCKTSLYKIIILKLNTYIYIVPVPHFTNQCFVNAGVKEYLKSL